MTVPLSPRPGALEPNVRIDTSDSQVPPCEDHLYCDPEYPIEAYASWLFEKGPRIRCTAMPGSGPNDLNFPLFPFLEGPTLLQPIFLKNLRTPIQRNTTYVVVTLSLTHKGNFSIVLPRKSNILSKQCILYTVYSFWGGRHYRFAD